MDLPPHAIDTLWNDGADVVYGTYMFRHGWPLVVNALQYINGRNIGQSLTLHPDEHQQAKQAGRWRVSGVGLGCTLIRRSVLEQIDFEPDNDGQACDMPFARACVKAGIEQYARFDVACGHATRQGMIYA
jgi:hypothetical protein